MARVHVRSWQAAYARLLPPERLANLSIPDRARRWRAVLQAGTSQTVVAEVDASLLGLANYGPCRDPGAAPHRGEIWALYVDPDHWSRGVGRALLAQALADLASQGSRGTTVWVLAGNTRAIRFYAAAGFVAVPGVRKTLQVGDRTIEEVQYLNPDPAEAPDRQ